MIVFVLGCKTNKKEAYNNKHMATSFHGTVFYRTITSLNLTMTNQFANKVNTHDWTIRYIKSSYIEVKIQSYYLDIVISNIKTVKFK